jgi:hypothetical protein
MNQQFECYSVHSVTAFYPVCYKGCYILFMLSAVKVAVKYSKVAIYWFV